MNESYLLLLAPLPAARGRTRERAGQLEQQLEVQLELQLERQREQEFEGQLEQQLEGRLEQQLEGQLEQEFEGQREQQLERLAGWEMVQFEGPFATTQRNLIKFQKQCCQMQHEETMTAPNNSNRGE